MQAVFPIYLLNSTVSFLSVISCVRRGRLFNRAGGEAIRFTARAAVSSAGARLRGPPNGTRAGPVAAVPPAAAGPARRTRRNGHTPLSQAPIYIDTRNAQKVAPVLHFFKKIFVPLWMRTKIFRAAWNWDKIFRVSVGWDRNGEKRAAARWGNRSVVPQGMGIKMGRKRAARPPGRLGRNGRSARRVAGGLDKNGEKAGGGKRAKRGAGPARSETRSARAPRDGKRPAERGGSGRRDVGRVRRVSARRARKGAKKRRLAPALLGWFVRSCAVPQRAVKGRGGDPVQQISAFRPGMRAEALVSSSRPTRLA